LPGSGIHRHHILPKHMGGLDEDNNYTYLYPREHQIAHFLLWKIYKNPNDLRSMHMLGAKLTISQRKIVGIWCRDNKIGIHGSSSENRKQWALKGLETQKESNNKKTFYYWSTETGRKERCALGGKSGSKTQIKNKIGIFDSNKRTEYAKLGGQSLKGMICVTNGIHRTRIKPHLLDEYVSNGYRLGFTLFS